MIRLRLALNFSASGFAAGWQRRHPQLFPVRRQRVLQPGESGIVEHRAFPARSQLPEVRTMPPSQREENWRSAMPRERIRH